MANRSNLPEVFGSTGWNPLREFSRLQRRMDRIFDEMMEPWSAQMGRQITQPLGSFAPLSPVSSGLLGEAFAYAPACEVNETADHYLISFDLPGVAKEDVRIEMRDRDLCVSGERRREEERKEGQTRTQERYFGSFERSFSLPSAVDADKIQANYENGVLEIVLPKKEAMKGKQIEISAEKGGLFRKLLSHQKKSEKAA